MILTKLNARLQHAREEGSAMIFALVVLMVALTLTMTFGAFALTNLSTTRASTQTSAYQQSIESALNNALSVANSDPANDLLANYQGTANAVTGSIASSKSTYGSKWRWYTERVAVEGQPVSYNVYATAYTTSPTEAAAKTQRGLLTPTVVNGANVVGSVIEYTASDTAAFQWGLFGYNNVKLPGVTTGTYDSSKQANIPGTIDTKNVQVASLGVINLTSTTGVATFNKFGTGSLATRCVGGATCTALEVIEEKYTANLNGVQARVSLDCPNPASSYPDYRASTAPYLLSGCYNNIYLDASESIPVYASADAPIRMMAKGNIIVSANVTINGSNKAPALQIYSEAGNTASFAPGTGSGVTRFNGYIAGNALTCSAPASGSTVNVRIFGGLACNVVDFASNTVIAQDLQGFTVKSSTDKKIWSYTKYDNLY